MRYCVALPVQGVQDDTLTTPNMLGNTEANPRVLSQEADDDDDLPPPGSLPLSYGGLQIGDGGGSHDYVSSLHAALSTSLQTCQDALQDKTAALGAKEKELKSMAGWNAFLKTGYQAKDAQMQELKKRHDTSMRSKDVDLKSMATQLSDKDAQFAVQVRTKVLQHEQALRSNDKTHAASRREQHKQHQKELRAKDEKHATSLHANGANHAAAINLLSTELLANTTNHAAAINLLVTQHAAATNHLRAELSDRTDCVVCFERVRTHVCMPCGHFVLCGICVAAIATKAEGDGNRAKCPTCNTLVDGHLLGYVS